MQFIKNVKLHSREHLLADDLSRMLGEEKRFAAYLGIAKRYYESDLRALARRVREKRDLPLDARGKYFFAALRDKPRRDKKRRRRKKVTKKRHAKKSRALADRQNTR